MYRKRVALQAKNATTSAKHPVLIRNAGYQDTKAHVSRLTPVRIYM